MDDVQYLNPALYAMRMTVACQTGLTPFYSLYGQRPAFPFGLDDPKWQGLEWDSVTDRSDLLTIRTLQIAERDENLDCAVISQRTTRQRT
ncbi:hypothetical protein BD410DRAFT_731445 [Rickenella mellea]|uniref:Uncharacterized protein n=1 Tax=Rickenella mellea TaxID=50990 RepID=A0A4Y7PLS6_9AGAM|nr:hypothetical protein BD410DRAFT_731445 [Rickenella mellea]